VAQGEGAEFILQYQGEKKNWIRRAYCTEFWLRNFLGTNYTVLFEQFFWWWGQHWGLNLGPHAW
jgi:hypothetical protein